jgi:hypothetical protein
MTTFILQSVLTVFYDLFISRENIGMFSFFGNAEQCLLSWSIFYGFVLYDPHVVFYAACFSCLCTLHCLMFSIGGGCAGVYTPGPRG